MKALQGLLDINDRDLRFILHLDADENPNTGPLKSNLRFRNRTRCLIDIRGLAASMAAQDVQLSVEVAGPLHTSDVDFIDVLRKYGVLTLSWTAGAGPSATPLDDEDRTVRNDGTWLTAAGLDEARWSEVRRRVSRYLRYGDSWTARWLLELALKEGTRPPVEVFDLCGLVFQMQEMPEQAAYYFSEAVQLSGRYGASAANSLAMSFARHLPKALYDLERADRYLDLAFKILEEDPDQDSVALELALNWNSRAYLRMVAGQTTDAVEVMRTALRWLPDRAFNTQAHAVLVNNLGRLLQRSEPSSSDIEPLLRQATEIEAKHPEFWLDLAMYLADNGRIQEAMVAADAADALTRSIAEIPALRGFLHFENGAYEVATAEYRRSLRIDPSNTETRISACRAAAAAEDYIGVLGLAGERIGDVTQDVAADLEILILEARSFVEDVSLVEMRAELRHLAQRFPDSDNVRASLAAVEQVTA